MLRNRDSGIIHADDCAKQRNAARWAYGDTLDGGQLSALTAGSAYLHLCKVCLPGLCQCLTCGQGKPFGR